MMKNFDSIFKGARTLGLARKEKEVIRHRLLMRMREKSGVVNDVRWFLFLSRHTVAALAVFVLFVSGGASVLAENALPGDVLYFVKTGLNEEVRGWFAQGGTAEAQWEIELAERRLSEVSTLEKKNRLTESERLKLKEKVDLHAQNAEKVFSKEKKGSEISEDSGGAMLMEMTVTESSEAPEETEHSGREWGEREFRSTTSASAEGGDESEATGLVSDEAEEDLKNRLEALRERYDALRSDKRTIKVPRTETSVEFSLELLRARETLLEVESSFRNESADTLLDRAEGFIERAEKLWVLLKSALIEVHELPGRAGESIKVFEHLDVKEVKSGRR